MATKSEPNFANSSPPPLPQNYDKNEPAVSLPKGLGTDGLGLSIGAQPSTPRLNPKNTSIITPEHTPPQSLRPLSSSSQHNATNYSTDPGLECVLSPLNKLSLSNTPILPRDGYEENNTDTLLYRLQTATSKSTYSRSYGFRCSGWIDSRYTSGVTSERQKNGRAFQAHCNDTHDPSPYISVSTSIARIMRLSGCQKEKQAGSRVFVISLNRLRQLGIKAQSTKDYLKNFVDSAGEKIYWQSWKDKKDKKDENRVSYVTDTHWLVEEWIPDQAIVSEMDCEEFLKIADREGISWADANDYGNYRFKEKLEPRKIDLEKWPKRNPDGKN